MSGQLLARGLLVFSVSLLAFCLGIWLERNAARRAGIDATFSDILKLSADLIRFTASRMAASITMMMLISGLLVLLGSNAMSFWAGYGFRDHELANNIKTRAGLEVKAINPAGNFDLLEDSGKVMHYNPCPGPRPQWIVGMRLKEVRYEQMPGCKRLEYFSEYADPSGKIQTGELANVR